MAPILLLMLGSLIALIAGIVVGRAKPDQYESPLLQKENWVGYLFASLGLAYFAHSRLLVFSHAYALEHNHNLGLDYFGIDLDLSIVLIYATLALAVACYLLWRRKTPKNDGPQPRKRIIAEITVLIVTTGIVTFGSFVWPTPWHYFTGPSTDLVFDPPPAVYPPNMRAEYRVNQLTGECQVKRGDYWEVSFGVL